MDEHYWLRRLLHLYAHGEGCYPLSMGLSDPLWWNLNAQMDRPTFVAPSDIILRRTLMTELIAARKEERCCRLARKPYVAGCRFPHAAHYCQRLAGL